MRVMRRIAPGSSKGRTTGFGPVNGGSNPPPGTSSIMRAISFFIAILIVALASSCKKGESSAPTATSAAEIVPGCDHNEKSSSIAKHSWPYPADYRDLRWGSHYKQMQLKLKPTNAAFVTATVTWKKGELIGVEDSEVLPVRPGQPIRYPVEAEGRHVDVDVNNNSTINVTAGTLDIGGGGTSGGVFSTATGATHRTLRRSQSFMIELV